MHHDLSERIRQARHHAGLSTRELSDKIHMNGDDSDKLEAGRSQLPHKIVTIASLCGVDALWLSSGYGDMLHPAAGA